MDIYKKKMSVLNNNCITPVEKLKEDLFREGEDQEMNQKAVSFTHWNSGAVYSGVVDSNFLLLNERHCRVAVPGQKQLFTVKFNDLQFKM